MERRYSKSQRQERRYRIYAGILAICIPVIVYLALSWANYPEHYYERKNCEVVWMDGNKITVEDNCGFYWSFDGEGYKEGDKVTLLMNDSNTSSIVKDDVIIKVTRQ